MGGFSFKRCLQAEVGEPFATDLLGLGFYVSSSKVEEKSHVVLQMGLDYCSLNPRSMAVTRVDGFRSPASSGPLCLMSHS